MASEPTGRFRAFLQTRLGRVVLILIAIGVVFALFSYVATILAIPGILVAGLVLPIWAGVKRPRFLAILGLIVIVAVAPLATVVFSQEALSPPASASTPGVGPYEANGSVLQNASVTPFTGSSTTNFTWTVQVFPKFLNKTYAATNWSNDSLDLYVSSCPGATSTNLTYCGSTYTFYVLSHPFSKASPPTNGSVITFTERVPANGIWAWQMALLIQNVSSPATPYMILLAGDPTYNGLEGPIVGGFGVVYAALIGTLYEVALVYLGIPFFFVLLLYMWYKGREARRKDDAARIARVRSSATGDTAGPPGSAPPPASGAAPAAPVAGEVACPRCSAVVYPGETKCWKCGATLSAPSNPAAPLPSKPQ
jgi:hypothetical protein